ncbi:hypothetical protein CK203_036411 [Vitis vinifera]|uniref:Reverse transcriptase Ty1/copia-type domain-containing protein n=1 Tax=Vitis vinifera TaxID=29760 RepID=A0A438HYR1_VITVI|nr:hypothetical protein CK203_036411 [Vitis vinifera]
MKMDMGRYVQYPEHRTFAESKSSLCYDCTTRTSTDHDSDKGSKRQPHEFAVQASGRNLGGDRKDKIVICSNCKQKGHEADSCFQRIVIQNGGVTGHTQPQDCNSRMLIRVGEQREGAQQTREVFFSSDNKAKECFDLIHCDLWELIGFLLLVEDTIYFIGCKTPYEILYGQTPSYKHIRTFGCLCYAHDQNRDKDKFASRSRKEFLYFNNNVNSSLTHNRVVDFSADDEDPYMQNDMEEQQASVSDVEHEIDVEMGHNMEMTTDGNTEVGDRGDIDVSRPMVSEEYCEGLGTASNGLYIMPFSTAPKCWFTKLAATLTGYGFKQSYSDYSLFTYKAQHIQLNVLVYVDDLIISGNDGMVVQ